MVASPSVENYYIGKGICSFKPTAGSWRDLGNVTEVSFTPNQETLDHYSSRGGIREKDLTVALENAGECLFTMEEYSLENLGMAVMGDVQTAPSGYSYIDIFSTTQITGEFKFTGTNDVGPKLQLHLLRVDIFPSNELQLISEEFASIQITAQVAAVDGNWGTLIDLNTVSGSL